MRSLPLRVALFFAFLVCALVPLTLSGWFVYRAAEESHYRVAEADLVARTNLLLGPVSELSLEDRSARLDQFVLESARRGRTRITVLRPDGLVLADSEHNAESMDNHRNRPEIQAAVQGVPTSARRFSNTLQLPMLYHATPILTDGRLRAILRTATPINETTSAIRSIRIQVLWGLLLGSIFVLVASVLMARTFTRSLPEVIRATTRFAEGDLDHRIGMILPFREGRHLAESLNQMAARLENRVQDLTHRNEEQDAIFQSMSDGVIAVDKLARIISINPAARAMFEIETAEPPGRLLTEVIRSSQLSDFVSEVLTSEVNCERDLDLGADRPFFVQAQGSPLRRTGSPLPGGAIIVLNDITRQRHINDQRRELIANVSHELRTPVTAIKGYLETLEGGALEDPNGARRFVAIARRQTDRLHALIEDLLQLARVEGEAEEKQLEREECALGSLLSAVVRDLDPIAERESMTIDLQVPAALRVRIHAEMLEQAMTNLITNAIRYGRTGQSITVKAEVVDQILKISVRDQGEGIPAEHLPRLFERFYTVDQARSRQRGGTGLGLSIVKHIARAHDGDVVVESELGVGSLFTLRLPGV